MKRTLNLVTYICFITLSVVLFSCKKKSETPADSDQSKLIRIIYNTDGTTYAVNDTVDFNRTIADVAGVLNGSTLSTYYTTLMGSNKGNFYLQTYGPLRVTNYTPKHSSSRNDLSPTISGNDVYMNIYSPSWTSTSTRYYVATNGTLSITKVAMGKDSYGGDALLVSGTWSGTILMNTPNYPRNAVVKLINVPFNP
jgi:hypothetical protein